MVHLQYQVMTSNNKYVQCTVYKR